MHFHVCVIGLGKQFRDFHMPMIKLAAQTAGMDWSLDLVVDLPEVLDRQVPRLRKENPNIISFKGIEMGTDLENYEIQLLRKAEELNINRVIIASEPSSHLAYLKIFSNLKVPILVDKPIVCRPQISVDSQVPKRALEDFIGFATREASSAMITVNSSRRYNEEFGILKKEIDRCRKDSRQEVTFITVFYADGEVRDIDGVLYQENHPFCHGYGGLNHSTYHPVDVAAWLSGIHDWDRVNSIEVSALARSCREYLLQRFSRATCNNSVFDTDLPLDEFPASTNTEYDTTINVKITYDRVKTLILSVSSIHESPTMGSVQDRAEGSGSSPRMTGEFYVINQGDKQRFLLRRNEFPGSVGIKGNQRRNRERQIFLDVVRDPSWATALGLEYTEVLMDQLDAMDITKSGKYYNFLSFFLFEENAQAFYPSENILSTHLLSQMILILAAQSISLSGEKVQWEQGAVNE
ncbi:hypothetical protein [Corynebacterium timonense]|uniref:Oxidoreductase family, NAD-binding Rossmann fold n=1 Tax=Corynebacterium timonense TaxID=441500 RepID=A0A1H1V1U6_9CORY|nr:hypothetical protein [Corynebacterium timonense]SDS78590.1 hypothetical protein SAMN04488539_2390 [Corynebacterium timonense]